MKISKIKTLAISVLAGGALFGGCLGLNLNNLLSAAVTSTAIEFVLDNDGVFDLFEGGATAANQ